MLFTGNVRDDAVTLCGYVDAYYSSLGMGPIDISLEKMFSVATGMALDCPYPHGIEAASPFKKVASFTTNMVASRPIMTPIPDFGDLATHQNAIVAFSMSIDMLEGATIHCAKRGPIVLEKRITVSKHFFVDTISALSFATPLQHFSLVSLLFESLAYEANPNAPYDKVF